MKNRGNIGAYVAIILSILSFATLPLTAVSKMILMNWFIGFIALLLMIISSSGKKLDSISVVGYTLSLLLIMSIQVWLFYVVFNNL